MVKDPSILQTSRSLCSSFTTSWGLTLTTMSLSQSAWLIYNRRRWWWTRDEFVTKLYVAVIFNILGKTFVVARVVMYHNSFEKRNYLVPTKGVFFLNPIFFIFIHYPTHVAAYYAKNRNFCLKRRSWWIQNGPLTFKPFGKKEQWLETEVAWYYNCTSDPTFRYERSPSWLQ